MSDRTHSVHKSRRAVEVLGVSAVTGVAVMKPAVKLTPVKLPPGNPATSRAARVLAEKTPRLVDAAAKSKKAKRHAGKKGV